MVPEKRAVQALEAALQTSLYAYIPRGSVGDLLVRVDQKELRVRWLKVGWPQQVEEALRTVPKLDVVAAPRMSPGARALAKDAGVGWVDESGAADIVIRDRATSIIVKTEGKPLPTQKPRIDWKPATLAVCEAILRRQVSPTVEAVMAATELSTGSVVNALKFLEQQGHLERSVDRGPGAARRVVDGDQLLDAYATAAEALRSSVAIRVGVLWRDPVAGVVELGRQWDAAGVAWAVTSAVSASVQAPLLTEVSPWEIYVEGKTFSTVRRAASLAGLREIDGGRLILRPFPTPAAAKLTEPIADGLRSVLWPRTYADLRISGVRGDEAADHLREEMTRE